MKTLISIEGMSCEHCVKHVTDALQAVSGVKKAAVSLKARSAEVEHADGVTRADLEAAVIEAGYEVPS